MDTPTPKQDRIKRLILIAGSTVAGMAIYIVPRYRQQGRLTGVDIIAGSFCISIVVVTVVVRIWIQDKKK